MATDSPHGPFCRSCQAPITWALTSKGKPMPVDREPTADGNLILERTGGELHARPAGLFDAERYTSHFATCPHAAEHRGRGP